MSAEAVGRAQPPTRQELLRRLRHDLRTPINHVIGYSELLLEECAEQDLAALTADLEKIQRAGRDLLALVAELIDRAQDESDQTALGGFDRALRDPLNTVIGYSDLLMDEAQSLGGQALIPDLRRIRQAGTELFGLLSAVRELAGGIAGVADEQGQPPARQPLESLVPAARPAPPLELTAPAVASVPGRLLVVDDDPSNRDILARRLSRLGHQVTLAEDGRRAIELLTAQSFDLVLLDVMMPELDGFQVLALIRANEQLRHLPVIVLSASDETDSAVRCIELGAEDYLPKPCDSVLLRARIAACLEKKRLRDQEQRHLATIASQAHELAAWNQELETRVRQQVDELDRLGRLRRFLSPQLADLVVSSGNERLLESHRREITVVFCDLRGFTAFTTSVEPEDLMGVLHEYHTALGELIFEHEGTLERFSGDGVMVFFNDPVPIPDAAERAIQMAIAMRQRVGELARSWRRRGYDLGFGVGIALGYATLGRIGFEGRFDYGAIGTVTNLAARLCAEALDGQILVSQRVGAAIEELAHLEPVGELSLKGFATPQSILNVRGLR